MLSMPGQSISSRMPKSTIKATAAEPSLLPEKKTWARRTKHTNDTHMKPTLYKNEQSVGNAFRYSNSSRIRMPGNGGHGPIRNKGNFFLSPLFPCTFKVRDTTYKSVAHYMQCRKYSHPKLIAQILAHDSPMDAILIGKGKVISGGGETHTNEINDVILDLEKEGAYETRDNDWFRSREMVMQVGNYLKFSSNEALYSSLMDTGEAPIIEDSDDLFWGEGKMIRTTYVHGTNNAGKSLEVVRKLLRKNRNETKKEEDEAETEKRLFGILKSGASTTT